MTAPAHGSVAWFEVGGDDLAGLERFYGGLLGWRTETHNESYRIITTGEGHPLQGGFYNTGGQVPNYAIFVVAVDDVPAICKKTEQLGGKVLVPPTKPADGPEFAHLVDPSGNHFGVFTPMG